MKRLLVSALALCVGALVTSVPVTAQMTAYNSMVGDIDPPGGSFLDDPAEVGDEITIAPAAVGMRLQDFTFQYWGAMFSGNETVRIRFYYNDGPIQDATANEPQTMFFDSGDMPAFETSGRNSVTLNLANRNINLPSSFTWSIEFGGIKANSEDAGVMVYEPPGVVSGSQITYTAPAVGGNYYEFWQRQGSRWDLVHIDPNIWPHPMEFGAQITAVPEPWATPLIFALCAVGVAWRRVRR